MDAGQSEVRIGEMLVGQDRAGRRGRDESCPYARKMTDIAGVGLAPILICFLRPRLGLRQKVQPDSGFVLLIPESGTDTTISAPA